MSIKKIQILRTDSNFEREKLVRPFGFKGNYLTELWQIVSKLESDSGINKIGLATQSVLYGDAKLFTTYSEAGGNALMYALVSEVLKLVGKSTFTNPVELLDNLLPETINSAKRITGKPDLHVNFIYNALVSIDNAAWMLYAAENNYSDFHSMLPEPYGYTLSHRNNKIGVIYQVSYDMPVAEIQRAAQQGYFIFKIKTGYPGSPNEMLERDKDRLTQIHCALKDMRTHQTSNGRLLYTMDANGRYKTKESILSYLEHAKKIEAFDQILLYEEPFEEDYDEDVSDIEVRIAGDESIHDEASALKRLQQGYSALVLKSIAKTLSLSLKLAQLAHKHNVPCLCADLTVNPILIDWNKNMASRLAPFPGIEMGLMEINGDMNYSNWQTMMNYHPCANASWTKVKNGIFELDESFYLDNGGIFKQSSHYQGMFTTKF
ncbi:L-alanine-DL-glutamate epimerase [Pedobacter sp. BS3]|uniref:enolase C-terminal domain-like protein n=1 Tax=Pedobacter sp. BS3 TaxID=2567937 RepID=UPI0011ECE51C|nr:enolase C-terminal domain-like protein [Pedobacter sp. BS3]TZF81448.1 L-alanine-DL-glutamate epimerase [Pedobacter sp. BS3]